MKSKILYIIVITIIIFIGFLVFRFVSQGWQTKLVSPNLIAAPSPNISPSPSPKTFKFDSSTNLKQELETINPQVLDSDFNE